jgi:type IV pilus assembly protein PilE
MTHQNASGFSLIELMIVVAIIGIIAAFAYPAYNDFVLDGRRSEAKAALTETAHRLERCFSAVGAYNNASCNTTNIGGANIGTATATETGFYNVNATARTATGFTLQAVPQGVQAAADTECGTLTLDQAGTKGISGTGTVGDCW